MGDFSYMSSFLFLMYFGVGLCVILARMNNAGLGRNNLKLLWKCSPILPGFAVLVGTMIRKVGEF